MPLSLLFFFVSITGIFLSDVFVITESVKLNLFLTILSPFFLFLLVKLEGKKILIPKKESFFYFLFILFSIISIFFAIDREVAFKLLLIYISGYLFFIYSFNYRFDLNKYFKQFLIVVSIFSCLILFINTAFHLKWFQEGVSLFYSYSEHNQIGNLLILSTILTFPKAIFFLFFIFILSSYSRSAYLSLILIFILKLIKNKLNKKISLISGGVILFCLIFIVISTHNLYLTKNKQLIGGRNIYFSYAISSIKEKPWFGVGPGNFEYAVSKRLINYGENTTTAHNIILDIFAENGILAGIFFTLFLLSIFYRQKLNNNLYMLIALTFMFMIDFSYRFNTFFILLFVLNGLVIESNKNTEINIIFPCSIILFGTQFILLGQVFLNYGLWKQSLLINPFQKNAYEAAIEANIQNNNKQQVNYYLQKYDENFGRSYKIVSKEIDYNQNLNDNNKIISLYEREISMKPLINIKELKKIWSLYVELYGKPKGSKKMALILKKIKNNYLDKNKKSDAYKLINSFCLKTAIGC